MTTVSAVVPTIPPRRRLLARALGSVRSQTRPVDEVVVTVDHDGLGAAHNRNRGVAEATGEWLAFLDDDDVWLPTHVERLVAAAEATGADVVYPWFQGVTTEGLATRVDGKLVDPFGVTFGPEQAAALRDANFIPVTLLARASLVREVGGFQPPPWANEDNPCEDWGCWLRLLDAGARFHHVPAVTWRYHQNPEHTAGRSWTAQ